ncbi:MAG: putative transposase [Polaribacter sp.]|jgi:putative transposase
MHIEYLPLQYISSIVKKLKGRTSRKIQQEFPLLKKQ